MRHRDGARPRQEIAEQRLARRVVIAGRLRLSRESPQLLLGEKIDTHHRESGFVHGGRPFDDRRDVADALLHAKPDVHGLLDAARPADDLVRRLAGHGVHRQEESLAGAGIGKVDGHDDGHADADTEQGQRELQRMPEQVAEVGAKRDRNHWLS